MRKDLYLQHIGTKARSKGVMTMRSLQRKRLSSRKVCSVSIQISTTRKLDLVRKESGDSKESDSRPQRNLTHPMIRMR